LKRRSQEWEESVRAVKAGMMRRAEAVKIKQTAVGDAIWRMIQRVEGNGMGQAVV
jgi:hypothetical protein